MCDAARLLPHGIKMECVATNLSDLATVKLYGDASIEAKIDDGAGCTIGSDQLPILGEIARDHDTGTAF